MILSELLIAVFCGLIFAMPVIAYELGSFVSPGLHDNERSTIIRLITPITLLFVSGSTFAYYLVIPFAVDFLYTYAQELGALAFITVPLESIASSSFEAFCILSTTSATHDS